MLIGIGAVIFAIIQALLGLRLVLPFVRVPKGLSQWVPSLVTVTDWLIAPFAAFAKPFNLAAATGGPFSVAGGGLPGFTDKLDSGVIVAMVAWGIVAAFVTVLLSIISRSRTSTGA